MGGPSVNEFISKTKSRQQQGLQPTGPELIAYARYLGVDPVADHDLLWIAEEALAAPLQAEWTEHFDSSDRVFYYNAATHVSSWTHPLEHVYRETYKTIVDFRNSNLTPQEKSAQLHQLQHECQQQEQEVHREITAWSEHTDERGHKFYFNREQGHSSWTDPRPAKCHILYLKMKMIRILCQHAGVNLVDGKAGFASRFDFLSPVSEEQGGTQEEKLRSGKHDAGGVAASEDNGKPRDTDVNDTSVCLDGDEVGEKKKKKKKHKHADKSMNHSQSAPTVGDGAHAGNVGGALPQPPCAMDEVRQALGFGNASALAPNSPGDGIGTQGRAKIKAGIRLQPLNHSPGIKESASVPVMQPLHNNGLL